MPVGDRERAFANAAAADGVVLVRARVPWLNQRGHYGLPAQAESAVETLGRIFDALGGLADQQEQKRLAERADQPALGAPLADQLKPPHDPQQADRLSALRGEK